MRLVTWNCKGGFSRKHESIARLKPDVLVLPEAARLEGLTHVLGHKPVNSTQWIGENARKGLGVVSYGEYSVAIHKSYDPNLKWVLPLAVDGPMSFTLFAIWTVPNPPTNTYAQCLFDACDLYQPLLTASRVVLAGDFNNSVAFDKPKQDLNFANLLARFEAMDLRSLYHASHGCEHGREPEPTFYLHHHPRKAHHIDFVFTTSELRNQALTVSVGQYSDWHRQSDHMPITCTFESDGNDA